MSRRGDTRESIVAAAQRVMLEKGLARATTREIAREAGVAEGTLYVHFRDRGDLFLAVMRERLPVLVATVIALPERVGKGSVRGNLEEVARAAIAFFQDILPLSAALLSEPDLFARHCQDMRAADAGPHRGWEGIAAYLRDEQRLGRVADRASPVATAVMLLGACQQFVFAKQLVGEDRLPLGQDRFVKELVRTLMEALAPRSASDRE